MKLLCVLFGHTWWTVTEAPDPRWNTTKDMTVLEPTGEGEVRFFEECRRCGERHPIEPSVREKRAPAAPPEGAGQDSEAEEPAQSAAG